MRPFENADVARVFAAYPPKARRRLLALRELIFTTAAATAGVGQLEETLRWGEPAYATSAPKSGSTIRIDWKPSDPEQYAMYVHCRTNLIASFRRRFADRLTFEGNRAILFDLVEAVPRDALASCIAAALTYRRRKTAARRILRPDLRRDPR